MSLDAKSWVLFPTQNELHGGSDELSTHFIVWMVEIHIRQRRVRLKNVGIDVQEILKARAYALLASDGQKGRVRLLILTLQKCVCVLFALRFLLVAVSQDLLHANRVLPRHYVHAFPERIPQADRGAVVANQL